MADSIIGSVGIQIEADASDLQGQYDAAVAQSQEAAGKIGAAFESLVGIGAALAITEGIKNFGEEALTAFGDIEKTSISIEHMTGSMEQTAAILAQVKQIGLSSPFSFPELQDTAQKMIAMGVPADKIEVSLRGIADAAAATGKSLLVAGGAFDRITETGSAAARQLAQIGVTTERLADVLGVTKDKVLQAFKDLPDQAARIDILNQAMERFAGSAEAQASGILGAWQILENRFELVLQGIGSALEPAIKDVISFGTAAVDYAQKAVDAFGQLPGPVKEVIGVLGLAVAGIAPLTVAVGTLGLGIIGVRAAITPLNEVLMLLGLRSGEAAIAEGAAATATAAQGTAAAAAIPEIAGLAGAEGAAGEAASVSGIQMGLFGEEIASTTVYTSAAITQLGLFSEETGAVAVASTESAAAVGVLGTGLTTMGLAAATAGVAIAAIVGYKIGQWAYDNIPGLKAFGDGLADILDKSALIHDAFVLASGDYGKMRTALDDESQGATALSQKLSLLGITITQGSMSTDEWIAAMMRAVAAHTAVQDKISATQKLIDTLTTSQEANASEVKKWQDAVALAGSQLDGTAIKTEVYEAALQKLDAAQKKLAAGSKDYQDTLSGLTETYNKQQGTINTLENTIGQLLAVQDRTQAQDIILAEATTKLTGLLKVQADAHGLVAAAAQGQGKAYDSLVKSADDLMTKEIAATVAVSQAKAVLDQLTASTDTSRAHTLAVISALEQYGQELRSTGGDLTKMMSVTVDGTIITGKLGDIVKQAKDHLADFNQTLITVPQVVDTATGRLNGMVIPLGFVSTGLSDVVNVINNKAVPAMVTLSDKFREQPGLLTDLSSKYFNASAAAQQMVSSQAILDVEFTNAKALVENLSSSTNTQGLTTQQLADKSRALAEALQTLISIEEKLGSASGVTNSDLSEQKNRLDQLESSAGKVTSAFGSMGEGFKATSGQVNALSYGVALLVGQLSGLTVYAGSGIDYSKGQSDLQHQLYLAQQAAGNPAYQPTSFVTATGGPLKGESFSSIAEFNQALADFNQKAKDAAAATKSLGDAAATSTNAIRDLNSSINQLSTGNTSFTKSVDGLSGVYTTTNKQIDYASLSGSQLADVLDTLNSELLNAGVVVDTTGLSAADAAKKLQETVDGMNASSAAAQNFASAAGQTASAVNNAAISMQASAADLNNSIDSGSGKVVGPDGKTYNSAQDLYNAIQANPNLLPHIGEGPTTSLEPGGTGQSGTLYTFNGQVVSEAMYRALTQNGGGGPAGSSADFKAPSAINTGAGVPVTWNTGPQASNTQGPQGITLVMNYPVFQSQQQSSQIFSQAVTMLRTVPGIKL